MTNDFLDRLPPQLRRDVLNPQISIAEKINRKLDKGNEYVLKFVTEHTFDAYHDLNRLSPDHADLVREVLAIPGVISSFANRKYGKHINEIMARCGMNEPQQEHGSDGISTLDY